MTDLIGTPGQTPGRRRLWLLYLLVFLTCAALYALTAQRGVAWQDSGIFQYRILHFDVAGDYGVALSHPTLIVLGKVFGYIPAGDVFWRMNLVSAAFAAVATANIATLVRRVIGDSIWPAIVAAGLFAVAHSVWWLATIAESQTVYAAIFTLNLHLMLSLVRQPRPGMAMAMGVCNGLGLTVHNLALLALPACGVLVIYLCAKRRMAWRHLAVFVAGWLIGASAFLVLVAAQAQEVGLLPAISGALFGTQWQSDVVVGSASAVVMGLGCILLNFPNAGLVLAAVGLTAFARRVSSVYRWLGGYLLAAYLLFAIRYSVPDQFMFFLPLYCLLAILAGLGMRRIMDLRAARPLAAVVVASILLTPVIYAIGPGIWRGLQLPVPGRTDLAQRDSVRYWMTPWKHDERSAEQWAQAVLSSADRHCVSVIADNTTYWPLVLKQETGPAGPRILVLHPRDAQREDIPIGTAGICTVTSHAGNYPMWITIAGARLEPTEDGVLYRVVWPAPATMPGDR